jgi:shikimate dehydrogenase
MADDRSFEEGGTLPTIAPSVLVGLIGTGIQASRTPALHERRGAEHGLRCIYKLIDLEALGLGADALPELLTAAQSFGFAGLNITHPCKQAVIPLLDDLSPDARDLGAVNTVVLKDGRRVGHNTDWWGFAESFRRELTDVRRDRVVQFGAGGAGAAVAHALLTLGVGELAIVDTEEERAVAWRRPCVGGSAMLVPPPMRGFPRPWLRLTASSTRHRLVRPIIPAWLFLRACSGPISGLPTSCTFPWRRSFSAKPAPRLPDDVGWRHGRLPSVGAFRLFTGRDADPGRMLRHFGTM